VRGFYGTFGHQIDFVSITADSLRELVKKANDLCIEKFGEYEMKRSTLQVNQVRQPNI